MPPRKKKNDENEGNNCRNSVVIRRILQNDLYSPDYILKKIFRKDGPPLGSQFDFLPDNAFSSPKSRSGINSIHVLYASDYSLVGFRCSIKLVVMKCCMWIAGWIRGIELLSDVLVEFYMFLYVCMREYCLWLKFELVLLATCEMFICMVIWLWYFRRVWEWHNSLKSDFLARWCKM